MRRTLLFAAVIFTTLLRAQSIAFDMLYGNSGPEYYSIGHYPIPGNDGLLIKWDGGIRLTTTSSTALQVLRNNNIGIGTETPQEKLTVFGNHENSRILLSSEGNGSDQPANLVLWASEPSASYTGVGVGNNITNYANGTAFTRVNNSRGGSYMRLLENEVNFNLVSNTGEKRQRLTVSSSGIATDGVVVANGGGLISSESSAAGGSISLANPSKTGTLINNWKIYNMTGGYGNSLQFWSYSADGSTVAPRLKLSDDGNMALLGKFEAREVKVTTTPTADFVFDEDYKLPKLEEVERHIREKRHLPEIASAKEMETDGVNVGEFQIRLLQKIEELTLYIIAQDKTIKAQQDRLEQLENRVNKNDKP
ncbi:hypothetical protein [Chryseobacterium sp. R2A-55]|uniref:hypothetical protein n=1 Tax=Chryseobacterium sp. R2A-55 TaxID=2744445 RepID=UPI001F2EA267|nr:hypothetical protein [Chryseobacterium sp. R2A-55]